MITRRTLLGAPVSLVARPEGPSLDLVPPDRVILRGSTSQQDGLILPGNRARIAGRLNLSGHDILATSFGADATGGMTSDLLALTAMSPGKLPRLVGLEMLSYADGAGTRLTTRVSATSDGSRLVFIRSVASTSSRTLVIRSNWIDYLAWFDGAPLVDTPVHPPPANSLPLLLAIRRARVRIALYAEIAEVTPSLLRETFLIQPLTL